MVSKIQKAVERQLKKIKDEEEIERIKEEIEPPTKRDLGPIERILHTGSTLLNLACSGSPDGGLKPGHYYLIVGDTDSGKSFWSHTLLAEASIDDNFNDYRLIYDDVEYGSLMNIKKLFGACLEKRKESPSVDEIGDPKYSSTIEDFFFNLDEAFSNGKPFIYILDSQDSLTSDSETEKFQEEKEAYKKGKEVSGSYGDGKAKQFSKYLRQCIHRLKKTGSILIIICQIRDNIGFGAQFNPKIRSGGHALAFYATLQIWLSCKKNLTKTAKDRQIGILSHIKIKRNRFTGKKREIDIPIYWSSGIDEVGSCVEYLIQEGHWKKTKGINAPEFEFTGTTEKLIEKIQDENLEKKLREIVTSVWKDIEESCQINRKSRYT
jgi:hypothetical protein